jgi:DNA-binding transcriptional LysR family regulator
MNIEGLRYAHAVSQTKSFSAAARAYGVTQPALSNGIARLEQQLGLQLFDRSPRGVKPTVSGTVMLPLIERALAALDAVATEAERLASPGPDTIRLGVSPLIGSDLVARAFSAARELTRPKALVLREADLAELRRGLSDGELDLILIPAVEPAPRLHHRVIHREPIVVLDPTAPPGDGPVELEVAAAASYILVPGTCGLRTFTTGLFDEEELALQTYAGEASNYRVLEEWARLGLGAALLPQSKISSSDSCRPLVRAGRPVEITYEAVWPRTSTVGSDVADLVEAMAGQQPVAHSQGL